MRRGLAILGALLLAGVLPASAERFVLAWPPTFYPSAELIVHRGPATEPGPWRVQVSARGFSADELLPEEAALRLPLPEDARCGLGVDTCAIVVESEASDLRVVFQSPDTAGVPDTLVRTAHDSYRALAASEAGRVHAVMSFPNSEAHPDTLGFATIVPVDPPVTVSLQSDCAGDAERVLQEGEAWTLDCPGALADLTGSLIESSGPVVVVAGNRSAEVPVTDGGGSHDLLMQALPPLDGLDGGSSWLAAPLPTAPGADAGGFFLRCVAGRALDFRLRSSGGGDSRGALAAGEVLERDTGGQPGDTALLIEATGPLACTQFSKSRVHSGVGDPAALPLVPRESFTTQDRVFVPDGYGEGSFLLVAAETGTQVRLDGSPLSGFTSAPGGELGWLRVELPVPPAGTGSLVALEADGPFGAWLLGLGGYKAHGLVAARARPAPAQDRVLRGLEPQLLESAAEVGVPAWCDPEPGALVFYEVEGPFDLRVSFDGAEACLAWTGD